MVARRKAARRSPAKLVLTPPSPALQATWRAAVYGGPGDYPFPNPATPPPVVDVVVIKEVDLYVAQCLTVDESSFGPTPEIALARLHEAVQLHYEMLAERTAVPAEMVGATQLAL